MEIIVDYDLLLKVWLYGSVPFIVSDAVTSYQFFVKGRALLGVHKRLGITKMRGALKGFQDACNGLPWWVVPLVVVQVLGLVCILDGLLWILRPYKQLKKMWNVLFWNFVKV